MSDNNYMQFTDLSVQQQYSDKGFATVPFLNEWQISALENIFHKHFKLDQLPAVYDTVATTPAATIQAVNKEVLNICGSLIEQHLKNYYWVCSIYFVKKSGGDSYKGMHLDTSMTIEGFNNIGVWIPLCDIDERNGQICLLSGSQKWLPPYSTPSMPYAYEKVEHLLTPKLTCLNMKAGEALFFNNSMLHCTGQNTSGKTRLAVIIKLIDVNAPMATVYYNAGAPSGEQVSLYEHTKDFFVNAAFRNPQPPATSRFVKFIPELPVVFKPDNFFRSENV
ncbi:MAG: phytanoyl-CoA dioxygenase family protein [Chitinophagales bacterium]|nr:phytanoyl-CoA dioxygenase family protein [Chitinophagales bacterium]